MPTTERLTTIVSDIAQCGNWLAKNSYGKVQGENASKLWHYLRYLDKFGSGYCYISLSVTCKFFNRSTRQVKRWLKDGLKLGFFRSYRLKSVDCYVVYYTSALNTCKALGLRNLGAIAQVPVENLRNLRQYASKITALAHQRATEYRQSSKKVCSGKIDIREALQPSGIGSGVLLFRTRRYLVCKDKVQLVGGSQKGIADKLGRSEATVQRHLSVCKPTEKRQLAVLSRDNWLEVGRNKLEHKQNLRLFKLEGISSPIKAYCNLYHFPEIEPRPQKYLRQKLKITLQKTQLISSTYQLSSCMSALADEVAGDKKDKEKLSRGCRQMIQ